MERDNQIVLVTGASSGIGNEIAAHLAKRGYRVYGTSRNPGAYTKKADEYFELLPMDVTNDESVDRCFASILEREGKIDILVCNAGMGLAGSVEESSMSEIRLQMETNYFGTLRCIKKALPLMRTAKKGRILVFSSIAGLIGLPFQAFYSSSKFALEGLVEALRHEVARCGVELCLIEPGDFHTGFTDARRIVSAYDPATSPYAKTHADVLAIQERDERNGYAPLVAAKLVHRIIQARRLRGRYLVGPFFQRLAVVLRRFLPAGLFEFLFRKMYRL